MPQPPDNSEKPIFGPPVTDDPDDAPELLEGFFERAEIRHGDRIIRLGNPPIKNWLSVKSEPEDK